MKLIPCELEKLRTRKKTRMSTLALLKEFSESPHKCVELTDYHHVNAKSCYNSIARSIKHYRMEHIRVITSKGKVYLYNLNK